MTHELVCNRPIDHAVIIRQREIDHRTNGNGVVNHDRAFFNRAQTEDRDVRLVDNREAE